MSRARDTADTQDNLGGAVAPFVAGKNKVINGDFGVWQRGTSFTLTSNGAYQPDRFQISSGGSGTCATTQQTFTPGTAPVAGYEGQYFLQVAYSVSGTSTILFESSLEDVRLLAGQTATFSFWGRVTSGTFSNATIENVQRFGTGGSGAVVTQVGTANFTTAWQRFSGTATIPSVSGKTIGAGSSSSIRLNIGTSGTSTFQIWGVQVEAGNVATPFTTASGSIGGELALCQRYYQKSYNQSTAPASGTSIGAKGFQTTGNVTTAHVIGGVNFGVAMRTTPTVTIYGQAGGSGKVSNGDGTDLAANSGNAIWLGETGFAVQNASGGSITPTYNVLQCHYVASAEL